MLNLLKTIVVLALLGVPLLVVTELPRLFDLAGSVPAASSQQVVPTATPGLHLTDAEPVSTPKRFAPLEETPPPTLVTPALAVTPMVGASPRPTTTGERIVIGNTGGLGAVLRADPVTGRPVAALREQQVLDVLERRSVPGSGDWLRVRTPEGVEGWVTAVVALPAPAANH